MRTIGVTKNVRMGGFKPGIEYLAWHKESDSLYFVGPLNSDLSCLGVGVLAELWHPDTKYYEYGDFKNYWWRPFVDVETRWYQCCTENDIYKRVDPERLAPWALEKLVGLVFKSGEKTLVLGPSQ